MSETTYEFVKDGKVFTRKESELTQEEQDLLLGELIHKWNKSPSVVKTRFLQSGMDAHEKHKQTVMNEFWKTINQNKEDEQRNNTRG